MEDGGSDLGARKMERWETFTQSLSPAPAPPGPVPLLLQLGHGATRQLIVDSPGLDTVWSSVYSSEDSVVHQLLSTPSYKTGLSHPSLYSQAPSVC